MEKGKQLEGGLGKQKEAWKPLRAPWALQRDVVAAVVDVLEQPNVEMDDVARAILENEIARSSLIATRDILRNFIKRRYGTRFEEGGDKRLLADLHLQELYLETQGDNIPYTSSTKSMDFHNEILERNRVHKRNLGEDASSGE